jgi:hypothetical protein
MRVIVSSWVVLGVACSSSSGPGAETDPAVRRWAEACHRLSGCEPYASTPDPVFTCEASGWDFEVGTSPADCALAAADCDAAVSCFGAGAAPTECAGGTDARCDGDVLRECDSGRQLELARDCAAEGLSCRLNDFDQAHCARPGACTEDACDGDVPVHCFGGISVPWAPCSPGRCVDDAGSAQCAGEAEPCDGSVFRCDGDVAVSCRGGFIHREPCRPGACRTDDGARCIPTGDCTPRCEGTSVVRCVGATLERYDCTEWGFSGCVDDGSGRVRCR